MLNIFYRAKVNRTLIKTVMSSLLYLLSYNPYNIVEKSIDYYSYNLFYCTDKGFAPIFTGHEPVMLLLHQSALYMPLYIYIAPKGFEPLNIMMKTSRLKPLDYEAYIKYTNPVQVLHLLQLITKQLHYFYAN